MIEISSWEDSSERILWRGVDGGRLFLSILTFPDVAVFVAPDAVLDAVAVAVAVVAFGCGVLLREARGIPIWSSLLKGSSSPWSISKEHPTSVTWRFLSGRPKKIQGILRNEL